MKTQKKFTLAADMFRLTIPYLLFMSLTALASSGANSYGSFTTPAFSPVLLNLAMIAGAIWLTPYMAEPIMALGWAVLIAGALQLAIQIPELWHKKLLIPPKVDFKHEGVDRILKLMLPALFGVSVTQINLLLNTIWASFMQDGSVLVVQCRTNDRITFGIDWCRDWYGDFTVFVCPSCRTRSSQISWHD